MAGPKQLIYMEAKHVAIKVPTEIKYICFSPNGDVLAGSTWGNDSIVYLWNLSTRTMIRSFSGVFDSSIPICFSPDGKLLAGAASRSLTTDISTGAAAAPTPSQTEEKREGVICVYGVADGKAFKLRGHVGCFQFIRFSRDGKFLVSMGSDHVIRSWDLSTREHVRTTLAAHGRFADFCISVDDREFIGIHYDGAIERRSVSTGELVHLSTGRETLVSSVSRFSPDGRLCVIPYKKCGSCLLELWDVSSHAKLFEFSFADNTDRYVSGVWVSFDGKRIAVSCSDNTIHVFSADLANRREKPLFVLQQKAFVSILAFSPDGKYLAFFDCNSRVGSNYDFRVYVCPLDSFAPIVIAEKRQLIQSPRRPEQGEEEQTKRSRLEGETSSF